MSATPDTCTWLLNNLNTVQPKLLAETEFAGLSWEETMALRIAVSDRKAELQWLVADLCKPWFAFAVHKPVLDPEEYDREIGNEAAAEVAEQQKRVSGSESCVMAVAVPEASAITASTEALRLAQIALRRWTDLYAHLQNESGAMVSKRLDYNLPPAEHLKALEAIEEALAAQRPEGLESIRAAISDLGMAYEGTSPPGYASTTVRGCIARLRELTSAAAPCGECHLQNGETCDICGKYQPPEPSGSPELFIGEHQVAFEIGRCAYDSAGMVIGRAGDGKPKETDK